MIVANVTRNKINICVSVCLEFLVFRIQIIMRFNFVRECRAFDIDWECLHNYARNLIPFFVFKVLRDSDH